MSRGQQRSHTENLGAGGGGAVHDARGTTDCKPTCQKSRVTESQGRSRERAMNNMTSFLGVTAAIFAAVTLLLVLMSHLESSQADQNAEDDPPR